MPVWIAIAIVLGLSLFVLLRALRVRPVAVETTVDAAFYREQQAEIDRQLALGQIGAAEAETARLEASRRLLAATRAAPRALRASDRARKLAVVTVLLAIPAVALPLYARIGSPDVPEAPLAARLDADPARMDLPTALARIEQHLAEKPEDGRGYAVVAPVYMRIGRYDDAVRSYASALRLLPETATLQADYGEALTAVQQGIVNADARKAFERALALAPGLLKARFYLARAAEQDGDKAKALAMLGEMRGGTRDPAQLARLEQEIVRLGGASAVPKGGEAIAALPQAEQQQQIRAMVDGLDARLAADGGSAEEWSRLVRAYVVLRETGKVQATLQRARTALAADTAALAAFNGAIADLGIADNTDARNP
jgi:cytochrome c-type biogenesis protein CcmH